jgi:protein-tyrosine phosphatase
MRSPLHVIAGPGPGRLATMAHPRGGDRLDVEMANLAAAGVDVLVSALTTDEVHRLALSGLPAAARAAGVELVAFPIPDRGVPDPRAMTDLGIRLAAHVRSGRFVVTHCFAGIGRASVLAAATLVILGTEPARALELVSAARGLPVPDTEIQRLWLHDFAAAVHP